MQRVLLREVPDSFDLALTSPGGRTPQVDLARSQHARYRDVLADAGHEVTLLTADDRYPDSVFVEDTAVVLDRSVIITRPGAPSRRGEEEAVRAVLGRDRSLITVDAPGTLDGGDVMRMGMSLWVGLSSRTNDTGAGLLADVAESEGFEVTLTEVTGVLHLKSAVLPVSFDTVVVTPGSVDETLLRGLRVIHEHEGERGLFSALPLANGSTLVTSSAPRTASRVESEGIQVVPIDVSEFLAADGGLTCLSVFY